MNNQVKNYLEFTKFERLRNMIAESLVLNKTTSNLFLEALSGQGKGGKGGVSLPITEDDLNFVHDVKLAYRNHGFPEDSSPTAARILSAKYALLHPAPLHNYSTKWEGETLFILDKRNVGGYRSKDLVVARVNDDMRAMFMKAKGEKATEIAKSKELDEQVAQWWMQENKDAIQDTPGKWVESLRSGKHYDGMDNPNPQIKITMRGQNAISLSFRERNRGRKSTWRWFEVKNIPIDMEKFKQTVTSHGFNQERHATSLLDFKNWETLVHSERIGKGGGVPNPELGEADPVSGIIRSKVKGRGYIKPGFQSQEINTSDKYAEKYTNDLEFRKHIELIIIRALNTWLSAKFGVRANIEYRDDTDHDIHITKFNTVYGIGEDTVRNVLQMARDFVLSNSGRITDKVWESWKESGEKGLDDWIRKTASSGIRSGIKKELELGKKGVKGRAQGMGDPAGGAGDGGRDGMDQGGGASHGGGKEMATNPTHDQEDRRHMISQALSNPAMLRNPAVLTKVKALASTDPEIAQMLKDMGIDLNKISIPQPTNPYHFTDLEDDEEEEDDDDMGSMSKYNVRMPARVESFQNYLERKGIKINEMGVVWGNDKKSANKLKPGQTLKGGIQVQGAPWTAGK